MAIPTGSPIIYQSNPVFASSGEKSSFKDKLKKHAIKLVLGLLVIGVVIELILGYQTLTNPLPKIADATNNVGVGKIVLDTNASSFASGDTVPVIVRVVTNGRATDSTDLILKYDTSVLEATESSIVAGTIYPEYVIQEVDAQQGQIRISAITPPNNEGFVGIGEFATINFRAKQNGNTEVSVDFEKGSTTDSNLVETGIAIDILDQVYNLNVTIGDAASAIPVATSCDGYYQYCHNLVGQTGRQFCTKGRLVENSCVFDPKLSVSCDICRLGY